MAGLCDKCLKKCKQTSMCVTLSCPNYDGPPSVSKKDKAKKLNLEQEPLC